MAERSKQLEQVYQKIDKLDKIWQQFPDFLRPDIKAFKESLVIDNFPIKAPHPPLYTGLKPEYRSAIERTYNSFEIAGATYNDHETGKTHINSDLLNGPERILEDFLSYQIGSSMYFNMSRKTINGVTFDEEERRIADAYKGEFCAKVPATEDTFIIQSGFGRRLFFDNGSPKGQLIADMPPKGDLKSIDEFHMVDEFFPQIFSLMTRLTLNKNADINEALKSIKKGMIFFGDMLGDSLNFSLGVYILTHSMDDNPWPLFDALLTGNTAQSDNLIRKSLTIKIGGGSFMKLLINLWKNDVRMIEQFEKIADKEAYIEKQIKAYWDLRKN